MSARELIRRVDRTDGALALLERCCAVVIAGAFDAPTCAGWVRGVYAARPHWTHDFGGEQFCLGRAFYTHYEEGRSGAYFSNVASSDARVEEHAPELQARMRDLVLSVTGATRVLQRRGWCGPGVHVFPPGGPVATRGGTHHFDTEGLAAHHRDRLRPAITLVAMLQTTETDGGLSVWDVRYEGHDHPTADELAHPSATVAYAVGDVVLIDSYRLHQIQPFSGTRERISATVHACEIAPGEWELWF